MKTLMFRVGRKPRGHQTTLRKAFQAKVVVEPVDSDSSGPRRADWTTRGDKETNTIQFRAAQWKLAVE